MLVTCYMAHHMPAVTVSKDLIDLHVSRSLTAHIMVNCASCINECPKNVKCLSFTSGMDLLVHDMLIDGTTIMMLMCVFWVLSLCVQAIPVSHDPSPRTSRLNSSASSAAASITAQQLQLQEQVLLQEQMQREQQLMQQQQQLQEQLQRQQLLQQQQQQLQAMQPWFPGMQQPGLPWPGAFPAAANAATSPWVMPPGAAGIAGTPGLLQANSMHSNLGWPSTSLGSITGSSSYGGPALGSGSGSMAVTAGGSALQGGLAALAAVKAERQLQQQQQQQPKQQSSGGRVFEYAPDLSGVLPGVGLVVRLRQQGSSTEGHHQMQSSNEVGQCKYCAVQADHSLICCNRTINEVRNGVCLCMPRHAVPSCTADRCKCTPCYWYKSHEVTDHILAFAVRCPQPLVVASSPTLILYTTAEACNKGQ